MPKDEFSRHEINAIANFRNLPSDENTSKIKQSEAASDLIDKLLHKDGSLNFQGHNTLRTLMQTLRKKQAPSASETLNLIAENWPKIVGEQMARYCMPLKIKNERILVIAVNTPTARTQINFLQNKILTELSKTGGCEAISQITVR